MIMLLMPWAVNMEIKNIQLNIVDNDHSVISQRLVNKIAASTYFRLTEVPASYEDGLRNIELGTADIIMEIPRHQQHDHTGKDKNQSRQKRIAKQLFKLFFYQKFYHNKFLYSNRYLNFLILMVISTTAISNKIPISLSTSTTGTPSIISLRTA
jgi:hypothetical protein